LFLLNQVADHALGARVQHVQRVGLGSGAIAPAAILMFRRCASVVIGSPRRSSALPPRAITIRIWKPPSPVGG
jgi:hypothetical protein